MTSYERIYEEAIGNYGLFRTSQAKALNVSNIALLRLAQRGRLQRLAYGLYRIDKYVPSKEGLDAYACAVAICGEAAYLWGPSVLAIRKLCPTDPAVIYVATPGRYRGKPRQGIIVKERKPAESLDSIEGISAQETKDAILSSQHIIMLPRLLDAVEVARTQGLLDNAMAQDTIKELYKND